MTKLRLALAANLMSAASAVPLQPAMAQAVAGTRLDIVATGKVSRVPDVAIISAGVQTQAASASEAIAQNAARMERVRAALKRAGIADRDIQTASISLNPDYRYADNQPPQLTGYRASNTLSVTFRDLKRTGAILDALVREGANQLNGPSLTIDKPEQAYDEARVRAIADGRARAETYARALNMRVVKLISVSESGASMPGPMPIAYARAADAAMPVTKIEAGEQDVEVSVSMSFELQ